MIDIQGTRAMGEGGKLADELGIKDPQERFEIETLFADASRQQRGLHRETGGAEGDASRQIHPLQLQIK